jgi:hypothetical protein
MYGRSSIKIADFIPIRLQTWPPQAILVSHWSISKRFSPLKPLSPNEPKLGREHLWKVLYQYCSFRLDPFWLLGFRGEYLLEIARKNNCL